MRVEDGKTSVAAHVFVNGIPHFNFILECSLSGMILCYIVILYYTEELHDIYALDREAKYLLI